VRGILMTNTIKISVSKSILEQIEECDFWDRMEKRDKAIDEGKGIKVDVYKLEERYLI